MQGGHSTSFSAMFYLLYSITNEKQYEKHFCDYNRKLKCKVVISSYVRLIIQCYKLGLRDYIDYGVIVSWHHDIDVML